MPENKMLFLPRKDRLDETNEEIAELNAEGWRIIQFETTSRGRFYLLERLGGDRDRR